MRGRQELEKAFLALAGRIHTRLRRFLSRAIIPSCRWRAHKASTFRTSALRAPRCGSGFAGQQGYGKSLCCSTRCYSTVYAHLSRFAPG